tara:strand:- start:1269 stop:1697 length:429 start_codon:yes stop_codon:yes gene_type:complete
MAQGIWIHTDKQRMRGSLLCERRKRALRFKQGDCNFANAYFGYSDKVKQIDTRCRKCGIRVRFNIRKKVGDKRGQVSQAIWISRPKDSRSEIEMKVNAMNHTTFGLVSNGNDGACDGFTTALKLVKEKNPRMMGGESDETND